MISNTRMFQARSDGAGRLGGGRARSLRPHHRHRDQQPQVNMASHWSISTVLASDWQKKTKNTDF